MSYGGYTPTVFVNDSAGLQAALNAATPGTIIGAAGGVNYSKAYPGGAVPAWQIANNGTAGNPIIVVAEEMASLMADPTTDPTASRLRHTGTFGTGTGGPICGCHSKSYQEWIGFVLDENHAAPATDMGTAEIRSSDNCAVRYCRIIGLVGDPGFLDDNHSGVTVRDSETIVVANNKISGYDQNPEAHNYNAVNRYDTTGLTVEHNEIFDCSTGIYFKDTPAPNIGGIDERARFNLIYDCRQGIEVASTDNGAGTREYYQNVIYDCGTGIFINNDTTDVVVWNNTLACNTDAVGEGGPLVGHDGTGADSNAFNNICILKANATVLNERYRTSAPWITNYNRYYAVGGSYLYRHDTGDQTSLAAWFAAWGVDANSTQGDPQVVSIAGNDYHLAPASVSLTLGNTGGPIGAYITGNEEIGIEAEAADEFGSGDVGMRDGRRRGFFKPMFGRG